MSRAAALVLLAITLAGCGSDPAPVFQEGEVTPMESTPLECARELEAPAQVVLEDAEALAAFWTTQCKTPTPEVDFEKSIVAGFFPGRRPNSGFTVTFDGGRLSEGTLGLVFTEGVPGPNCVVAQVLTHPQAIVVIDRPATAVHVEARPMPKDCPA